MFFPFQIQKLGTTGDPRKRNKFQEALNLVYSRLKKPTVPSESKRVLYETGDIKDTNSPEMKRKRKGKTSNGSSNKKTKENETETLEKVCLDNIDFQIDNETNTPFTLDSLLSSHLMMSTPVKKNNKLSGNKMKKSQISKGIRPARKKRSTRSLPLETATDQISCSTPPSLKLQESFELPTPLPIKNISLR